MQLPQEPTNIPPVRRYDRRFEADRTKTYTEDSVVEINIPPIDKTYLTKDVTVNFDFDLTYTEMTKEEAQAIATGITNYPSGSQSVSLQNQRVGLFFGYAKTLDSATPSKQNSSLNQITKPHPTFDINGPYGLISSIEVYDYKGSTLIEKVENHDLLTAMLADFDMKNDTFHVYRPQFNDPLTNKVIKYPCSFMYDGPVSLESETERGSGVQLTKTATLNVAPVVTDVYPVSIPTLKCCLNLYSFLGKLSNKFVPLHNGFTIKFVINKANIPIKINTIYGFSDSNHLQMCLKARVYNGSTYVENEYPITPTINSMRISNFYIKATLLEVSSELDSKIEKVIHATGYKYQSNILPGKPSSNSSYDSKYYYLENVPPYVEYRILPSVKSLKKVFVSQRPLLRSNVSQELGFRIKNYMKSGRLLYNKSVLNEIKSDSEAFSALNTAVGTNIDSYLTMEDFTVNTTDNIGCNGAQFFDTLGSLAKYTYSASSTYTTLSWIPVSIRCPSTAPTAPDSIINFPNSKFTHQGKFMYVFDCSIPGAPENAISGVDTSSSVVEYGIDVDQSSTSTLFEYEKAVIDVFCEHDMFIHVDPGKSTAVSF